jgi:oxalate---CoA ligase
MSVRVYLLLLSPKPHSFLIQAEAEGEGTRKKRFKWNSEYDELAVDAMTIIRVRAQNAERAVDLEPLRQVFPGIDRNGVRSRIRRIIRPIEGYVRRLGAAWGKLWLEAHGTDRLSDEDPNNLRDFDLAEHIIFLRQHIDKESL